MFYARTYDPGTGTFTTQDAWEGLLTRPGTLNAYAYVLADPLTTIDVLGYWPGWLDDVNWREVGGAVAGIAAGIAVGVAVGACIAATVGLCGGVVAGAAVAIAGGAAAGAAGAAASYAVTGNNGQYSWGGFGTQVGIGTVAGAATAGVGYGLTSGLRAAGNRISAAHVRPNTRPAGSRRSPLTVATRGTSRPTWIAGRPYSEHAVDRMYGRGIPPSVVEDTIRTGVQGRGSTWLTTTHTSRLNGVTVIRNRLTRRVVTVMYSRAMRAV